MEKESQVHLNCYIEGTHIIGKVLLLLNIVWGYTKNWENIFNTPPFRHMTPSARLKMLNFIFIFCILNSDYRSSSATSPRLHHHHHHRLERSSHRSSGHHHGHHHQLQHHNTWGGGGDMLQAATFALQASAFTSMSHSSSASGGSDHSSVLSSEQQQFSLPSFANSCYFPNSPPCSIGDADTLTSNPNNPDICVTNVIGDEVLLLGGGKPSSTGIIVSTANSASSVAAESVLFSEDVSASLLPSSSTIIVTPTSFSPASTSKSPDVEPMDMDEDS